LINKVGLIVPVFKNFQGFAELMASVDMDIVPIIIDNWRDNRGVSAGWNEGLKKASSLYLDAAFVVNDDVVFEPGTMTNMLMGLWNYDLVTGYNTRDGRYDTDRVQYLEHPDYSCFVVNPIKFLVKFGFFDESFTPAYFEDNDMSYRIRLAGGKEAKSTAAPFFHKGSVTQNWGGEQVVTGPMFERNREYYIKKWGGEPGRETFTKPFQSYEEGEGIGL
jgi:GT2 family glycosyltransferase